MYMNEIKWDDSEKIIARYAFEKAYQNEMKEIQNTTLEMATNFEEAGDVWKLHYYLTTSRKEINRKYDFRYCELLNFFSSLINQNYISESDLLGLSDDKLAIIKKLIN